MWRGRFGRVREGVRDSIPVWLARTGGRGRRQAAGRRPSSHFFRRAFHLPLTGVCLPEDVVLNVPPIVSPLSRPTKFVDSAAPV